MANPLILVTLCAMFLGGLGGLFMVIPMDTETWEYYRFNEAVLLGKNNSYAFTVVVVNPNETTKLYRVDHFPDKNNYTAKPDYLFAQDAGLMRICDKISGKFTKLWNTISLSIYSYIYIYTYIYMCVCVCVCVWESVYRVFQKKWFQFVIL